MICFWEGGGRLLSSGQLRSIHLTDDVFSSELCGVSRFTLFNEGLDL